MDTAGRGCDVGAVFGDDGAFDAIEEDIDNELFVGWKLVVFGHRSVLVRIAEDRKFNVSQTTVDSANNRGWRRCTNFRRETLLEIEHNAPTKVEIFVLHFD